MSCRQNSNSSAAPSGASIMAELLCKYIKIQNGRMGMLTIGICDDDELFTEELENLILKYLENNNFKADIQVFINSHELLKYQQDESNF